MEKFINNLIYFIFEEIKMEISSLFKRKSLKDKLISAEGIAPLFSQLGIDIFSIGFPLIEYINKSPMERYNCWFKDVIIHPKNLGHNSITLLINGEYISQAVINRTDSHGNHFPGRPEAYKFFIQEGKLKIDKKRLKQKEYDYFMFYGRYFKLPQFLGREMF